MLNFLFVAKFEIASDSVEKILEPSAKEVLKKSVEVLDPLNDWTHDSIHEVLKTALIEGLGLKPRIAFGAVRIAVTGSHISPPLFESMELLGKSDCLARIKQAITL